MGNNAPADWHTAAHRLHSCADLLSAPAHWGVHTHGRLSLILFIVFLKIWVCSEEGTLSSAGTAACDMRERLPIHLVLGLLGSVQCPVSLPALVMDQIRIPERFVQPSRYLPLSSDLWVHGGDSCTPTPGSGTLLALDCLHLISISCFLVLTHDTLYVLGCTELWIKFVLSFP